MGNNTMFNNRFSKNRAIILRAERNGRFYIAVYCQRNTAQGVWDFWRRGYEDERPYLRLYRDTVRAILTVNRISINDRFPGFTVGR